MLVAPSIIDINGDTSFMFSFLNFIFKINFKFYFLKIKPILNEQSPFLLPLRDSIPYPEGWLCLFVLRGRLDGRWPVSSWKGLPPCSRQDWKPLFSQTLPKFMSIELITPPVLGAYANDHEALWSLRMHSTPTDSHHLFPMMLMASTCSLLIQQLCSMLPKQV